MKKNEICAECFGEGTTVKSSKAIVGHLVKKKCSNCNGAGAVPPIVNSAFLNNNVFETHC